MATIRTKIIPRPQFQTVVRPFIDAHWVDNRASIRTAYGDSVTKAFFVQKMRPESDRLLAGVYIDDELYALFNLADVGDSTLSCSAFFTRPRRGNGTWLWDKRIHSAACRMIKRLGYDKYRMVSSKALVNEASLDAVNEREDDDMRKARAKLSRRDLDKVIQITYDVSDESDDVDKEVGPV